MASYWFEPTTIEWYFDAPGRRSGLWIGAISAGVLLLLWLLGLRHINRQAATPEARRYLVVASDGADSGSPDPGLPEPLPPIE